jgi:hypothetical protein
MAEDVLHVMVGAVEAVIKHVGVVAVQVQDVKSIV